MRPRAAGVSLLAPLLVLLVAVPPAVAARPPDIVLLVLDDMGVTDDRIRERLPAIRRLFLEEGLVADQAIGNTPRCPARRARHHGLGQRDGLGGARAPGEEPPVRVAGPVLRALTACPR